MHIQLHLKLYYLNPFNPTVPYCDKDDSIEEAMQDGKFCIECQKGAVN